MVDIPLYEHAQSSERDLINIIDPHVHFIDLQQGNYHWLQLENAPFWPDKSLLVKDVTIQDFAVSAPLNIKGLVHIEAGFDNNNPEKELKFVRQYCANNELYEIKTVAFVSLLLAPEQLERQLQKLIKYKGICGVRYIVDDKVNEVFNYSYIKDNFQLLVKYNLHFELQVDLTTPGSDSLIKNMLSQTPDLKVILNHSGFMPLELKSARRLWKRSIRKLCELPKMYIKVSGLEMINREYTQNDLESAIEECVDMFTDRKVCMASNFPLTTLSTNFGKPLSYQGYWLNVTTAINALNLPLNQLVYENASTFYQFE